MSDVSYRKPPIIEAVLEVRFEQVLGHDVVTSAGAALRRNYQEESGWIRNNVNVQVQQDGQLASVDTTDSIRGVRLTNLDRGEFSIPNQQSFLVSQIPDYPGWAVVFARFERDWAIWKHLVGYSKIAQVGLRYINRLDIPVEDRPYIATEQYVKLYAEIPAELGPTLTNMVTAVTKLPELDGQVALTSGIVASPLPGCMSILIDISVSVSTNPPQRDQDLLALLERLRLEKNRVFESCITDDARKLFH